MRVMLEATMDTDKANELVRSGKLPEPMRETMDRVKPESACFTAHEGGRTCCLVFDMQDSSQMPVIAEPFFTDLGARVEFSPVMNPDDLAKGLSQPG
ncbi:hypothetical protein CW362_42415 [Streptomyces populi]|uniref:DUF3303 domain-containing protein n=1 Tax=Streptomyces populi TaxID=2058924 RepID=A0A2I0SB05_9ACTN|nr:DUF3303 family protein [Streptomyces populi]PKT67084.1 hypothetical protein CW362_42415 [Streptomyces populi]